MYASEERGFDGGKKVKGRKRHIVVDTMGNLLAVKVHAANIHDTVAGIVPALQAYESYPTIEKFCGDAGYRGTFEVEVFFEMALGVDISERISPKFEVIPKRWVVERTFAWLENSRRLAKDYETSVDSAENMVRISHMHTLLRRLA
jgi:putative transposase